MSGLTVALPDGSTAEVVSIGNRASRISRYIDGELVWGQCFAMGGPPEDHEAQVRGVLDAMADNPRQFIPWWSDR